MNAIRKATFAVSALAITIVGAALATAPMAFARSVPVLAHNDCAGASLQINLSGHLDCADVSRDAGLIALNRR
jgi:hypothetical protein